MIGIEGKTGNMRNLTEMQPLGLAEAETLAVHALSWIAGQEEQLAAFLGAAGASASDVRDRAADPEFLGFLLDFLLADESALLEFCTELGIKPDRPARARAALPGGDLPHWT